MNLTNLIQSDYACDIPAIVGCEFSSSEAESGRKPTFLSAAFFVSVRSFYLMVDRAGRRKPAGFSFGTSLLTSLGLPPVFSSSDGGYIKAKEVLP